MGVCCCKAYKIVVKLKKNCEKYFTNMALLEPSLLRFACTQRLVEMNSCSKLMAAEGETFLSDVHLYMPFERSDETAGKGNSCLYLKPKLTVLDKY